MLKVEPSQVVRLPEFGGNLYVFIFRKLLTQTEKAISDLQQAKLDYYLVTQLQSQLHDQLDGCLAEHIHRNAKDPQEVQINVQPGRPNATGDRQLHGFQIAR
jgi:hypothetical protein